MIKKIIDYFNHDRDLSSYADTKIEYIALSFLAVFYFIGWLIFKLFDFLIALCLQIPWVLLYITCPIWIIPYMLYKKIKGVDLYE